jgi:hypothetical protein
VRFDAWRHHLAPVAEYRTGALSARRGARIGAKRMARHVGIASACSPSTELNFRRKLRGNSGIVRSVRA